MLVAYCLSFSGAAIFLILFFFLIELTMMFIVQYVAAPAVKLGSLPNNKEDRKRLGYFTQNFYNGTGSFCQF